MQAKSKIIVISLVILLIGCSKESNDDPCLKLREVEWYVNNVQQAASGSTWMGVDISDYSLARIDGVWQMDFSSPEYYFILYNTTTKFTTEELNQLTHDEWKSEFLKRCVWDSLDDLRLTSFIRYEITDGNETQYEYTYDSGFAYFEIRNDLECDMLEVKSHAYFSDPQTDSIYDVASRILYEYSYNKGHNEAWSLE